MEGWKGRTDEGGGETGSEKRERGTRVIGEQIAAAETTTPEGEEGGGALSVPPPLSLPCRQ